MLKDKILVREGDLKTILLSRSLEEGFGQETFASEELMDLAATDSKADKVAYLLKRSQIVASNAEKRAGFRSQAFLADEKKIHLIIVYIGCLIAFASGFFANYLSPDGRINLLLNPLAALFLWNVLSLIIQMIMLCPFSIKLPGAGILFSFLQKISLWLGKRKSLLPVTSAKREASVKSMVLYYRYYWQAASRPMISRGRVIFNLAAIAMAAGVVAGFYLRAVFVDYQFFIASTFYSSSSFPAELVRLLYMPATAVFNFPFPQIEGMSVYMAGAQWIHLLALNSLIYIFFPRFLLVVLNLIALAKNKNKCAIDQGESYYRQILKNSREEIIKGALYFYDFPETGDLEREVCNYLSSSLEANFQAIARRYYTWGEKMKNSGQPGEMEIVVFNGLQTPEEEIHGEFLESILLKGADSQVVVIFDKMNKQSLERRKELWQELISGYGNNGIYYLIREGKNGN